MLDKIWRSVSMGGLTRLRQHVLLNPGWKMKNETGNHIIDQLLYRKKNFELYDRYMDNTQYKGLPDWNGNLTNQQIDDRTTQPKKVYPLPQIASDRFSGLITNQQSRLEFRVKKTDIQEKIDFFLKETMFWPTITSAFPGFFMNGSMFIRFFKTENGKVILEPYNTKNVWPEFDEENELDEVTIRYVYDTGKTDEKTGDPIWRWAQYKLTKNKDIQYDNPIFDYNAKEKPIFNVESTIHHKKGFVQGVWIKNGIKVDSDDGRSYLKDTLDWLDDLNYFSSKESNAIFHSLYPTLVGYGVSPEDFESTMKGMMSVDKARVEGGSSFVATSKPPNEASLQFLENSNSGLTLSEQYLQRNINILQHILKITLHNPEVLLGYAQSAEAMKMLNQPLIEEINRMRPFLEKGFCDLLSYLEIVAEGLEWNVPQGTFKSSDKEWGELFRATESDKAQRTTTASTATQGRFLSRETATKYVAQDFNISNAEEELRRIDEEDIRDRENELEDFKRQNNPPPEGVAPSPPTVAGPPNKAKGKK